MTETSKQPTSRDKTIEIILLIIGGLFFFVLGSTRISGAYQLYNNEHTFGNFIWLQYCALLLAFGVIGPLAGVVHTLVRLAGRNKS